MYVIFPTHVSTKEPIWFHAFVPSQKKVRHYVTFHNTVEWSKPPWFIGTEFSIYYFETSAASKQMSEVQEISNVYFHESLVIHFLLFKK